jgi:hypothetical protein
VEPRTRVWEKAYSHQNPICPTSRLTVQLEPQSFLAETALLESLKLVNLES